MKFDETQHRKHPDAHADQTVTYEEIMDILARRHDYESIGDNDIM